MKTNKISNYLFYLFGAVIFLLPLERLGSFNLSGMNIRISQILIVAILGFYVFIGLLRKHLEIKFSKPLILYILFLCVGLLSLIGAKEKMRGIMVLAFTTFMIIVPYMTVFVLDNKRKLNIISRVLLISALLFSLFGLFQFVGDMVGIPNSVTGLSFRYVKEVLGFPRIQSTFIEPLYFANYLLIPMLLSFFLLLRRKNSRKELYILIALFLIFLLTMILTFSKGAIASLVIIFFGIFLFQIRSIFSKENIIYLFFTIIFISLIGWMTISTLQAQPDFNKVYDNAYGIITGGSVAEREQAYAVAIEAYTKKPFLGIGVGNFGPYFAGYPITTPDYGWAITNNEYLEVLSEMGIIGLLFFLFFIFSILYYSYIAFIKTKDKELKTYLLAFNFAFIGVLIQYMTFSTLYIMHIWTLIGLILATQNIILNSKDEKNKQLIK